MSQRVPAHQQNTQTSGTVPMRCFEGEASYPTDAVAPARPSERPREVHSETEPAGSGVMPRFRLFEGKAAPLPDGTEAAPRPPGKERVVEGAGAAGASDVSAAPKPEPAPATLAQPMGWPELPSALLLAKAVLVGIVSLEEALRRLAAAGHLELALRKFFLEVLVEIALRNDHPLQPSLKTALDKSLAEMPLTPMSR